MKNTFVKVLSLLMALMMAVGVFGTISFAAECDHTKGTLIETVKPTCQDLGYSRYTCGICGEEWVTDVIYPSAEYHEVIEYEATAASCLAPAYTAGAKCKYCDYTPAGVKAPAPVADSQLAHQFVGTKVAATCDTAEMFVYSCKLCTKTAEEINKIAGIQWVGGQTFAQYEAKPTGVPAKNHNYVWVIVTAPSNATGACIDGLTRGTCSNCGDVKESPIPVKHDYSVNLNPKNAVCGDYISGFACKFCGEVKEGAVKNNPENIGKHGEETSYKGVVFSDPSNPPAGLTVAELTNLGYKVGDTLSTASTCKTAGKYLVRCNCGELYHKEDTIGTHAWSEWQVVYPTKCTDATIRTRKCSTCKTTESAVINAAAFTAHVEKTEVTASTCIAAGYTTTVCTNKFLVNGVEVTCGHGRDAQGAPVKYDYKDKLGHNFGAATWTEGSCTGTPVYKKTCTTCNGKLAGGVVTIDQSDLTADQKAHTWGAEELVAATCAEAAYKVKTCTRCGDKSAKTYITEGEGKDPNPNNHVYPTGAALLTEGANVDFVIGKEPSCTKEGEAIVWCTNCTGDARTASMKTVTTGKLAHNVEDTTENCYKLADDSEKGFTLYFDDLAAKCNAYGYEADGTYCADCGYEVKAATRLDYDANNHGGNKFAVGSSVGATCQDGAYQMYNTSCHGLIKVYTDGGKKASHNYYKVADDPATEDVNESVLNYVAAKAPTCTDAGNHQYVACVWCGAKQVGSTKAGTCAGIAGGYCTQDIHDALAVTDNHVIPALDHDWKEVKQVNETCDDPGLKAHVRCARCGIVNFENKEYPSNTDEKFLAAAQIGKHSTLYQFTISEAEAKAATCISTGLRANTEAKPYYCSKCDPESAWVIAKVGHTLDYNTTDKKINVHTYAVDPVTKEITITAKYCNEASAIILSCTVEGCGYKTSVYKAAAKTGHTLGEYIEVPLTGNQKSCTFAVMQYKKCTNPGCQYTTTPEVKTAATGCYTTKGVAGGEKFYLDYSCNTLNDCLAWSCDVCGEKVSVGDDGAYVFANTNKADNPNKHKIVHRPVKESAPDTCTTAGFEIEYCGDCNYTDKITVNDYEKKTNHIDEIKGHYLDRNPNGEANVLVVEKVAGNFIKYICPTCNVEVVKSLVKDPELTVTVNASADKVAAGETFTVTYALSGVAHTISTLNLQATITGAATIVGIESNIDGMYAVLAPNGGISIIVANNAAGEAQTKTTDAAGTVLFTLTLKANETAVTGDVTVAISDKATENALATASDKVNVTSVGNLNGDAYVTAEDAQAIFAKIGTNDVASDVNCDGIVNLADVIALAKFAASAKTAADYLEMVGELDTLEAEVFALLESGKLNDVNEDKIVNISDAYALIERVTDELGNPYTKLGNKVTMKAVVAYLNVNENLPTLA